MHCPLIVSQWLCAWSNSDTHCLLTVEYTIVLYNIPSMSTNFGLL